MRAAMSYPNRSEREIRFDRAQLPLFECVGIQPVLPKRGTLPYRALTYLRRERAIDHDFFFRMTGSHRLAASICVLRQLGWDIETRWGSAGEGVYILHEPTPGSMEGL